MKSGPFRNVRIGHGFVCQKEGFSNGYRSCFRRGTRSTPSLCRTGPSIYVKFCACIVVAICCTCTTVQLEQRIKNDNECEKQQQLKLGTKPLTVYQLLGGFAICAAGCLLGLLGLALETVMARLWCLRFVYNTPNRD